MSFMSYPWQAILTDLGNNERITQQLSNQNVGVFHLKKHDSLSIHFVEVTLPLWQHRHLLLWYLNLSAVHVFCAVSVYDKEYSYLLDLGIIL